MKIYMQHLSCIPDVQPMTYLELKLIRMNIDRNEYLQS